MLRGFVPDLRALGGRVATGHKRLHVWVPPGTHCFHVGLNACCTGHPAEQCTQRAGAVPVDPGRHCLDTCRSRRQSDACHKDASFRLHVGRQSMERMDGGYVRRICQQSAAASVGSDRSLGEILHKKRMFPPRCQQEDSAMHGAPCCLH